MDAIREKLKGLQERYNEITEELMSEEVANNPSLITKLGKEQAHLEAPTQAYGELCDLDDRIEQANVMLQDEDPEMKEMARMELDECEPAREKLLEHIQHLLIPRDPMDDNNCIMEIRGGAGGDEGNIFAGDLYRMYSRYAESKGWKVQVMEANTSEAGGFSQIVFSIKGKEGVYGNLKWESGVHRVQRVPKTESQGRIQTSTATVYCYPEVEKSDFELDPNDLEFETHRASGAGGQHINKTDSAVRMTHIPTGIVVSCQTERSQIQNRERCLNMLKSKLLQRKIEENAKKMADIKGEQKSIEWGSQIRSYVFCPYTMVKDLRTGYEVGNIQAVMDGDLDGFIYSYLRSQIV